MVRLGATGGFTGFLRKAIGITAARSITGGIRNRRIQASWPDTRAASSACLIQFVKVLPTQYSSSWNDAPPAITPLGLSHSREFSGRYAEVRGHSQS
jgi:hypothetical protein